MLTFHLPEGGSFAFGWRCPNLLGPEVRAPQKDRTVGRLDRAPVD